MTALDWRTDAACKDMHPGLFYPQAKGQATHTALREIRPMCNACPVQAECYSHALHHELFGLWAGTSEKQRKDERRRLGIRVSTPETAAPLDVAVRDRLPGSDRQAAYRARARGAA